MALPILEKRTPTTMVAVSVNMQTVLSQSEEDGPWDIESKNGNFSLYFLDQDGEPMKTKGGELLQQLSTEQRDYQIQFLNDMRVLAEATLPVPE